MGRQYFDDGSWIETDESGTSYAANTMGTVVSKVDASGVFYQSPSYWTDAREAAKLEPYAPAVAGDSRPWYERVAEYGITRAIDSHIGPPAPNRTSQPATFAGQNGRTYSQVGALDLTGSGNGGGLLVLALGAAALFALA